MPAGFLRRVLLAFDEVGPPVAVDAADAVALEVAFAILLEHPTAALFAAVQ